jgi:hypothetical protein
MTDTHVPTNDATMGAAAILEDPVYTEVMRRAIEDELIDWRDRGLFELGGNGFTVNHEDGSNGILRFKTLTGLTIGLEALRNVSDIELDLLRQIYQQALAGKPDPELVAEYERVHKGAAT